MGFILHHIMIMPLFINILGGGHTHKHTRIQMFTDRNNSKKPGAQLVATPTYFYSKFIVAMAINQ